MVAPTSPLGLSASEMLRALDGRAIGVLELVDAHIRRIEALNPVLNAVVFSRFDRAREEARDADAERARLRGSTNGQRPLLGLPVTIKDAIDVEGAPTTGGLPERREHRAARDATVVARLRRAGAIVLGKTNTSTLSIAPESSNLLFGTTCNPFALDRSPGGSSGGEAAIIAAGGSAAGLGSDVGGSVRVPAHFCGIAAIKPTGLSVPQTGHFPEVDGVPQQFSIGPLARTIEDLELLLPLLRGPDGEDARIEAAPYEVPPEDRLRDVPVCLVADMPGIPLDREIRVGLERVATDLEQAGFRVRRHTPRALRQTLQLVGAWLFRLGAEGYEKMRAIVAGDRRMFLPFEIARAMVGRPRIDPALLRTMVAARIPMGGARGLAWAESVQGKVLDAVHRATAGQGALLCPIFPFVAPPHGEVNRRYMSFQMPTVAPYSVFVNLCGLPGVTVPAGITEAGLPFGLQIVANRHHDGAALAIARAVERLTGGYRPPPI